MKEKIQIFNRFYKQYNNDTLENFIYHFNNEFSGIDFNNKKILEIGCGHGFISLYIAYFFKPIFVDAVDESLGEGAKAGIIDVLSSNSKILDIKNINIHKKDIMQFKSDCGYDIIISNNAMHHVYEHGLLKWDVRAQKKYEEIFYHIKDLLKPDGTLILHEYSRYSIWRFLPNKRYQHIEWSLHPSKSEWFNVLKKTGYKNISTEYRIPYKLRNFKYLAQNGLVMFFYYPSFYIRAQKNKIKIYK